MQMRPFRLFICLTALLAIQKGQAKEFTRTHVNKKRKLSRSLQDTTANKSVLDAIIGSEPQSNITGSLPQQQATGILSEFNVPSANNASSLFNIGSVSLSILTGPGRTNVNVNVADREQHNATSTKKTEEDVILTTGENKTIRANANGTTNAQNLSSNKDPSTLNTLVDEKKNNVAEGIDTRRNSTITNHTIKVNQTTSDNRTTEKYVIQKVNNAEDTRSSFAVNRTLATNSTTDENTTDDVNVTSHTNTTSNKNATGRLNTTPRGSNTTDMSATTDHATTTPNSTIDMNGSSSSSSSSSSNDNTTSPANSTNGDNIADKDNSSGSSSSEDDKNEEHGDNEVDKKKQNSEKPSSYKDNDEKASDHLYSSKPSDQEEKLNKRDNKADSNTGSVSNTTSKSGILGDEKEKEKSFAFSSYKFPHFIILFGFALFYWI